MPLLAYDVGPNGLYQWGDATELNVTEFLKGAANEFTSELHERTRRERVSRGMERVFKGSVWAGGAQGRLRTARVLLQPVRHRHRRCRPPPP